MMDEIRQAMQIFNDYYKPALTLTDSDEQLTSTEILERLNSLLSDNTIGNNDIYSLMKESGYIYKVVFSEFKWLLKIRIKSN